MPDRTRITAHQAVMLLRLNRSVRGEANLAFHGANNYRGLVNKGWARFKPFSRPRANYYHRRYESVALTDAGRAQVAKLLLLTGQPLKRRGYKAVG